MGEPFDDALVEDAKRAIYDMIPCTEDWPCMADECLCGIAARAALAVAVPRIVERIAEVIRRPAIRAQEPE